MCFRDWGWSSAVNSKWYRQAACVTAWNTGRYRTSAERYARSRLCSITGWVRGDFPYNGAGMWPLQSLIVMSDSHQQDHYICPWKFLILERGISLTPFFLSVVKSNLLSDDQWYLWRSINVYLAQLSTCRGGKWEELILDPLSSRNPFPVDIYATFTDSISQLNYFLSM